MNGKHQRTDLQIYLSADALLANRDAFRGGEDGLPLLRPHGWQVTANNLPLLLHRRAPVALQSQHACARLARKPAGRVAGQIVAAPQLCALPTEP